jgi:hypothetical protein
LTSTALGGSRASSSAPMSGGKRQANDEGSGAGKQVVERLRRVEFVGSVRDGAGHVPPDGDDVHPQAAA